MRVALISFLALSLTTACGTPTEPPPLMGLDRHIREARFTPLEVPSGLFAPGAIIRQAQDASGETYFERVSSIETCGATEEERTAVSGEVATVNSSRSFDAKATASFRALQEEIGAQAQYVRSMSVKFESGADEVLDEIRLDTWRQRISGPDGDALSPICRELISSTPNGLYIIRAARSYTGGEYTIDLNANGSLTLPAIVQWLASAGAEISYQSGNTATFEGPVYFGIRQLYYAGGEPVRLGTQDVAGASTVEGDALQALVDGQAVRIR